MSEVETTQTDEELMAQAEREDLEAKANSLGVKFHPNIGDDKLREKIKEALADKDSSNDDNEYADTKAPTEESVSERRVRKQKEAAQLVRVQITCMNPNKAEWDGEVITGGNSVVGTYKKFVKFNVEYHVPRIIYNVLKNRKCQVFVSERDSRGRNVRKGKQINEFNIAVLPPLTKEELKDLAQRQAMAAGQSE